jgi:outer membrane autotransporter protein
MILASFVIYGTVQASTVSWSPTGQNTGGTGTWDLASSEWFNGTVTLPWNNLAGDSAQFGGTAGTVTLGDSVTVQDLLFATNGYTLNGGTINSASGSMVIKSGSGNTATINSVLAGSGRRDIKGGGTIVLGGANTYTGNTTVSGNSTLQVSTDANLGASAGTLSLGDASTRGTLAITGNLFNTARSVTLGQGGATVNVASGGQAIMGGALGGSGAFTFDGAGKLILSGANTYSGTTTITAGTLQIGNGGTSGALGSGAVTNNGILAFNLSNNYTTAAVISGSGQIQQNGIGTTILTGTNTYTGGTIINAGTLQIGNGGATGSITGDVTNNGVLSFSHNNTYTFAGIISGRGALQQNGGTTVLSGANTYTGDTLIRSGILQVDGDGNLGASSGQLHFTGNSNFRANSAFTSARNVVLDTGVNGYVGSNNAAAPLALSGVVSGAGALGVDSGSVILSGTNTYTGGTNIWGGTLSVSSDANLGNVSGNIRFVSGGILRATTDFSTSRNIALNSNGWIEAFNGANVTLNGVISGGGYLALNSAGTPGGTVTLTGNSTYTGPTYLLGGVKAYVANAASLGNSKNVSLNNGTLVTTNSMAINRIGLDNGAGGAIIDVAPTTTLTVNNDVYGSASTLRKTNTGTLVLAGANTSTSAVFIDGGTLQIGNGGTSGALGTGNITNNSALVFNRSDAYGFGSLISGSGTFTQLGAGTTTLSGNNTYTGATRVAAGSLYINGNQSATTGTTTVESGATLGGAGTLGGDVRVMDGGTLAPGSSIGAAGTLNIRRNLLLSGGSILNYNLGQPDAVGGQYNDLTIVGGDLTLDGTLNVSTTAGGAFGAGVYRIISYSGALNDQGLNLGTMPAGANTALQTSDAGQVNLINTLANMRFWDGATAGNANNGAVNGGTGIWNSGAGANSNWTSLSGTTNGVYSPGFAVFQGTPGTVTVDDSLGGVTSSGMQFATSGYRVNGDAIDLIETTTGARNATIRVGDGTTAGNNYVATIDTVLQGSAGLAKTDMGTLVLTGANTYTGGTTISSGTLQLGNDGTSGSVVGNLLNNGTLAFNRSDTASFDGVISGNGAVQQLGSGSTVLTGTNTYGGTTTISNGTLQLGNGGTTGTLGSGAVTVTTPGTLAFNRSDTVTYGGVISGTGSLAQNGSGTTVLTANNTFTGSTTINAGTLQLGDGTANGGGGIAGNVTNNGTLAFNRNATYSYGGVISGSGAVEQRSGILTLGGTNTYSGGTTLRGGELRIAGESNLGAQSGSLTFNGGMLRTSATLARDVVVATGGGTVLGSNGTLNGNISGSGLLRFYGGNTYVNGTNNTYSGGTLLSDYAVVVINSANALGTGKITGQSSDTVYGSGGKLQTTADMTLANDIDLGRTSFYGGGNSIGFVTDANTTLTLTGNINNVGPYQGNNGMAKEGAGTLVLANNVFGNGVSFPVRILAGSLVVGDGGVRGTLGAASAQIAGGAKLLFNRSDLFVNSGGISGAGSLEQKGSGTLALTGNATQTGGTTISAGTLQIGNGGAAGSVAGDITNNSNLAFNRSDSYTYGGVVSGTGALQQNGTGTTVLTGANTYTGVTTINAGMLQLGNGGTTGSLLGDIINNGTLAFNRSDAMTFGDFVSGSGGLLQKGPGNLILNANNTYKGATTVSAGRLTINGDQSAATGATTVASGANLGGTGIIGGDVTIANDGILTPGSSNGSGGTLTIKGNLALNDTSILRYTFGTLNGVPQNSLTNVNGNLTLDGRLDVTVPTGGAFDPGIYRIFNYGGTLTNNGLALGNMPAATTVALQTGVPGQINLINTTGILTAVWDGSNPANYNNGVADGGAGVWNRNLNNQSWGDASSSINSTYTPTSFVIFQGAGAPITVDTSQGPISTSGMQFAVNGYSLNGGAITLLETASGTGSTTVRVGDGSDAGAGYTATIGSVLLGSTRLTKTDPGKLVLTGTNSWSGGTAINGGTLSVASDSNLGGNSGALSLDGGTLETTGSFATARATTLNAKGGTLDIDANQTLTMNGVVAGAGKLSKTDAGKLVLGANNTYSGGTAINGGTLSVSSDAALGATTGALSLDGGTLEATNTFASARATTLGAGGGTLDIDSGSTLTLGGIVDGSGKLTKTDAGTLVLTGNNTYSGGTAINGGTLQIASNANLGADSGALSINGGTLATTATLTSARGTTFNAGGAMLAVNGGTTLTLTGTVDGAGALTKSDAGTLVLAGAKSYSGGTTIADGVLKLTDADSAGSGAVSVATTAGSDTSGLELAFSSAGIFDNLLTGAGITSVSGAQATIGGANSAYTGGWHITSGGSLAVANNATNSNTNLGTGGVDIAAGGVANISTTGAFSFNNLLTGGGLLNAASGGQAFSFGSGVGTGFTGTTVLTNNTFDLSGDNTAALTHATLEMGTGNLTTAGAGNQTIGNLTFNGGTLNLRNLPTGTVTANTLALTTGSVELDPQDAGSSGNLLAQDEGTTRRLVAATTVSGSADNLVLKDLAGNVLTSGTSNIVQGGNTVAIGTYSYGLDTRAAGSNTVDGLYAAYRLTKLALQTNQTTTLSGDTSASAGADELHAKLTGAGNLAIDATGTLTLSNATNDYTGETSVTAGTLRAGTDNALGQTSQLNLANTTGFDLNGKTQTLGALNGAAGSTLNINSGTLNLSNGGTSAGALTGAGQLNVTGGTLDVQGANSGLTAGTNIATGATVSLDNVDGLGSSAITTDGTLALNGTSGTLDNVIGGTGAVELNNAADVTLAGNNALSGSWNTAAGTRLTATQASNLGTAAINNSGTFNVDTTTDWTLANALNGVGVLTKNGSGTLTIDRANSYSGGSTVSGGVLKLTNTEGAGTGKVNIAGGAALDLALASASVFDNQLAGAGSTRVSGAQATITADNSDYTGDWQVTDTGTLAVADSATSSTDNLGSGTVAIAAGGVVNTQTTGAFSFDNALTGSGTLNVSNANQAFSFGSGVGANFAGKVVLTDNTFTLADNNTTALTGATLEAGNGNVTTVGDGDQHIGGLTINGGTMLFNASAPEQSVATSLITSNTLDVSHAGTVRINLPKPYVPADKDTDNSVNLLMQDEANVGVQLVKASTVSGSGGAITLVDQDGNAITAARQLDISQNSNIVARATYDYRLTSGPSMDGLYVNYGLKELDLQAGQTLTLGEDTGATGAAADMSAKITGSGSLAIDAGTGALSLSNAISDYTGETSVNSGTLRSESDNALGQTSKLNLANTTAFDLNGKTQTLGALNGMTGSTLNINGGTLNLSNGGTSAGMLTGAGQLNVTGGTLDVQGANAGLTAGTNIATGATVSLNDVDGLGSSAITTNGTLALNGTSGTLDNVIDGSGAVTLSNAADVILAGNNVLSGSWNTAAGTRLTATQASNLGTAAINNSGTFNVNTTTDWTLANALNGVGVLTKNGTGTLTIDRANSYSGGTTVSGGVLKLMNTDGAGSGTVNIDSGAELELALTAASVFDNQLAGAGSTRVSGAQATISADNTAYTGDWQVNDTGTLAVADSATSSTTNLGSGTVTIAAGGVVNTRTTGAFSFDNALAGSGTLNASNTNQAFSFGSGVGANFAGKVVLTDNTFTLSGNNTTALTGATFEAGSGNVTTVGDGNQHIDGLTINGGTLLFNASAPEQSVATSLITANTLDVSHAGTVRINLPKPYVPGDKDTDNSVNLLMQDEANVSVQLVRSKTTKGSGGAIKLVDQDGNAITAARQSDISQNGQIVAHGTYDYRLTSGTAADGLYVNYGLTELDLQADQTLTLAENTGATGAAADMSAKITGSGNLAIDAGTGVVSLSNATNDYRGETSVKAGTLRSEADNTLGQTSKLNLAASGGFDLNGKLQTIGALNGAAGSTLNINGGMLNVSNGGTSAGALTGAGQLNVTGGTLGVQGANRGLTADTNIATGATVSLNDVEGLGSSAITTDGILVLNDAAGTMKNSINGKGEVVKRGDSETVLTGKTDWTGNTYIDGGELVLDGSNGGAQLVSNIIAKDNTALSLRNGASLTGWIDPTDVNIDAASRWNMTADSLVDDVNLAGTLNYVTPASPMTAGRTLTANNWNGQDGTLVLNTVLGNDSSVTDKLLVNGNTSGNTFVKVNNVGGSGAQTVEGIRVVEVKGLSDGTFTKAGRIVAGVYDYSLMKKGADWFLTSQDTTAPATDPQKKGASNIRPESASYTANLAAANTMFITRLHDRLGETQYTDALTGEQKVTSMWLRQVGGHNGWTDSSGQLDTQSNRYITQLGGDIAQWSPDGLQCWHLGVIAGYGTNSSNTHSNSTGYHSKGSVDGYSAGLYATWYQNNESKQGAYLDSWAQYSWFNNSVDGQDIQGESYKSSGITASLEMGYTHKLGEFAGSQGSLNEWFIQPQAQAIWMGVRADDHRESNGTRVSGEGGGNRQTRLGVRTYLKGHSKVDDGKNRTFQPFVEVNWIHNTQSFGTRMDGMSEYQSGTRNIGEVKTGVEGQISPRLNLWGDVGVQVGDKGYSDASAMVGVKYNF